MWNESIEKALSELKNEKRWRELQTERGVSFSHNDYLGLSNHPTIREAGREALRTEAAGARGSRLLGGHSTEAAEVENRIARHFKAPAALLFPTGYQANLGIVQAMAAFADSVVSDANNHASLIDGVRLTRLQRHVLPHQAWADWRTEGEGRWLLCAESLYSMDGDFVVERELQDAWNRSKGFLILDEAHAAGVFGPSGRGLSEPWRDWSRMAVVVTFGKAFGVSGGAVLCSKTLKEWLINSARTFIYTTGLSPVVTSMICASLEVMQEEGESRRKELWRRAHTLREFLRDEGLPLGPAGGDWGPNSPILPLFIPGNDRALRFAQHMRDSGWELRAIRYPTVPQGLERIRISLNLTASLEQTEMMAEELVRQWKAFT